jgi:MFS family permease
MLLMGNMVCGFPWGMFQTLTTAYASEICPVAMRGYLTTWVSMCWGMLAAVSSHYLLCANEKAVAISWLLVCCVDRSSSPTTGHGGCLTSCSGRGLCPFSSSVTLRLKVSVKRLCVDPRYLEN